MAGKTEIVEHLVHEVDGLTRKQAKEVVDTIFETMTSSLGRGERVNVPGFGSFKVTQRAARKGRNPSTGATIDLPPSKAVRFELARKGTSKDALGHFAETYSRL